MSAVSAIDFVTSEFTPASPFAAASLNYSGRTVCKWHCDGVNLLTGLCLAIIFGDFDPKTSGHFYLNEARLIIELAPGDFFFFMSAYFGHKNGRLEDGKERRSVVLYTAANLFCWVHNGHRSKSNREELLQEKENPKAFRREADERFAKGLERLGNVSELRARMQGAA